MVPNPLTPLMPAEIPSARTDIMFASDGKLLASQSVACGVLA